MQQLLEKLLVINVMLVIIQKLELLHVLNVQQENIHRLLVQQVVHHVPLVIIHQNQEVFRVLSVLLILIQRLQLQQNVQLVQQHVELFHQVNQDVISKLVFVYHVMLENI